MIAKHLFFVVKYKFLNDKMPIYNSICILKHVSELVYIEKQFIIKSFLKELLKKLSHKI